jgi:hypothetical protein
MVMRICAEPFTLKFEARVCPNQDKWIWPLFNEIYALAVEYGCKLQPWSQEIELMHGRILVRWNAVADGFNVPLTATTTVDDICGLARARCDSDPCVAIHVMANEAWQQFWKPKVRELLLRKLVREELAQCEQPTR